MYILIAFFSPFLEAVSTLLEGFLSNRIFKRQTTIIFYISLMNAVFVPLVMFFGFPSLPTKQTIWLYILLGIIDFSWLYPYFSALKVIDTSIVAALFSLGQVTVPILSFFMLGEILNLHQYIGFMIIIMSAVALSLKTSKIPKLNKAFWYMVLVSILLSFRIVLIKYIVNIDKNWINIVIFPNLVSGVLPFSFLFVKKYRKDIIKNFPPYLHKFKFFALNEFICFLGMACSVFGLSKLSPVYTSSIEATQPIFLLTISGLLFYFYNISLKEKITYQVLLKKLYCFASILLGVMLVVL